MSLVATPHVAALAPYALADLRVAPGRRAISLAQNESALPPSPAALAAAGSALANSRLYPDPDWTALRAAIAEVHGLSPEHILCGAGSMELIAALAQAYLGPGRRALSTAHGYLFFRTATRLAGGEMDLAPEADLTVDVDALLASVREQTAVVFVANPGNPTGTRIGHDDLLRLRADLPRDVLLVVDEAYGEFVEAAEPAAFDLVGRGDMVVLRTFSKAYGLAGLRVGWGLFPDAVASQVWKVLNPNNVSIASQAAATTAMRDQAHMRRTVAIIAERRDRFAARMRSLSIDVPASHTNFVLLRFAAPEVARAADAALRDAGVLMRGMGGYGLADCLRATIGDEADMTRAGEVLAGFMAEGALR